MTKPKIQNKSKISMSNIKTKVLLFVICALLFIYHLCFLIWNPSLYAQEIKQPNVAGAFYPDNPAELSRQIDNFLNKANPETREADIIALISPHAGYEYSGGVAAYGYKAIKDKNYDTVIIIAPSHNFDFPGISIWPRGAFKTPFGLIAVDENVSSELRQLNPNIKCIPQVFSVEHSLEVQLPFLQKVLKEFKIVPLIMSRFDFSDCQLLAHSLKLLTKDKKSLVVASTDLSHYHPYQEANKIDRLTLSYIENLDAEGLYKQAELKNAELCGLGPVLTCLLYAQEFGLKKAKILKYANSADITGDYSRVVGYVSVAIDKQEPALSIKKGEDNMFSQNQKRRLLEIARKSIETYLKSSKKLEVSETDPVLMRKNGAFVTLHEQGELRGCIGNIIGERPLYLTVRDMAIEAAVGDPRFPPLKPEELKDVEIEISVLSELKRIDDPLSIELGVHGVLIKRGFHTGVFLPQVATETGWSKEEFLSYLCSHKAGLSSDAWKDKATEIYVFTAEVFSEKSH